MGDIFQHCIMDRVIKRYGNFLSTFSFQFGFGNMFPHDMPARNFSQTYRCYSVSMLPGQERQDVEKGGKSKMCLMMKKRVKCING